MKNTIKQELINDVVTGLLVAATFALALPADAFAQASGGLAYVGNTAQTTVAKPAVQLVSYLSYTMGTVMTVAGISDAKKHADSPGQNPLGKAIGKLGAGAAFLAAPSMVAMLTTTATATDGGGTGTFQPITGF